MSACGTCVTCGKGWVRGQLLPCVAIDDPNQIPQSDCSMYLFGVDISDSPLAVKNDDDKLRFDLIPTEPMQLVAEVYTIGAKKYDDDNWRKGMDWGRVKAALERHLNAWWGGEKNDPVDKQHHLASVIWCALTLIWYELYGVGKDTRVIKGKLVK
jgi:hypothetical protein|tara:strand:+ start:15991 stop:16455 length:465 start_codon:yes stop_codon:yes gene_type:complete